MHHDRRLVETLNCALNIHMWYARPYLSSLRSTVTSEFHIAVLASYHNMVVNYFNPAALMGKSVWWVRCQGLNAPHADSGSNIGRQR